MEIAASQSISYYQKWQSMAENGHDQRLNQHLNAINYE